MRSNEASNLEKKVCPKIRGEKAVTPKRLRSMEINGSWFPVSLFGKLFLTSLADSKGSTHLKLSCHGNRVNAGSKGPGKGAIKWAGQGVPTDNRIQKEVKIRFTACACVSGRMCM